MGLRKLILAAILAAIALAPMAASAEGKFSAEVFGDYYYFVEDHDSAAVDQNGFWFRRVNLTWDEKFDDTFSARVRLESASPGSFLDAQAAMLTFVKDAWVRWKKNGQAVYLGLTTTVAHSHADGFWGFRYLEKIPVDLQGFAGSRDIGIGVQGAFMKDDRLGYHVMVGNGTGTNIETDAEKKVAGAIHYYITKALVVEGYADYEPRVSNTDRTSFRGFAGYKVEKARVGVEYFQQTRDQTSGGSYDLRMISGFAAGQVADRVWLVGRVDRNMDGDPKYNPDKAPGRPYLPFDASVSNTFVLAGVEWSAHERVSLSPNVEVIVYDEPDGGGPAPANDVVGRLTFHYTF